MTPQRPYINKITKEELKELPAIQYRGEIRVVDTEAQIAEACAYLAAQPMLGFDTETRPNFTKGNMYKVALLQLSGEERCYLFRLNMVGLPRPLLDLLENPDLPKVGLDVDGDLRALRHRHAFHEAGFLDIQHLVREWGIEEMSLRKISAIVLGQRVSKAQRLSNWESPALTDKQQLYAATDAWVCTEIYHHLMNTPKLRHGAAGQAE